MPDTPIQEFIVDQLRDLYDAEKQLTKALPRMAKAASDRELAQGFTLHAEQTRGQVERIEQIFEQLEMKARSKPCEAMKGLIEEGREVMSEDVDESVMDMGLIAAARRVEHYEIAAYDTLIAAATAAKQTEMVRLLQETLREEAETDKILTGAAKRLLKDLGGNRSREESETPARSGGAKPAARGGSKGESKRESAKEKPAPRSTSARSGHLSNATTDHDQIRRWAEERGGKPACVRGTGGKGDIGMMRIEFPGKPNANDSKLSPISWDDFFDKFDERGLALVYQEKTADGKKSNFNKLVSRDAEAKPKAMTAR